MYERYFTETVGIDPQIYYRDTIRNHFKRAFAWENKESEDWKKYRFLAFSIIDWTFAGMEGKKVNKRLKKPEDLFKLPTDNQSLVNIKIDKEEAAKAVERYKKNLKKD